MNEYCKSEEFDQKEFKGKIDYFNRIYKNSTIEEHGYYHDRIYRGDY